MTRLLATIKTDVTVQFRNQLYAIGIGVGAIIGLAMSQLATPAVLPAVVPVLMLVVIGGSTMLYVGAMFLFERDEGTLDALLVSPLRPAEYLWSKIITLTALATIESAVMIGEATLIMSLSQDVSWPNIPLLLAGIAGVGVLYTLVGIVLVVRYDRVTEFLFPMAGAAVVLQLPILHYSGWVIHPLFLVIPTSAPTMLIQGAYVPLAAWQFFYATLYTAAAVALLAFWAYAAFQKHVLAQGV